MQEKAKQIIVDYTKEFDNSFIKLRQKTPTS